MTDDPRLRQLLDELLESDATPEVVCASCPELLPQVRARWRKLRHLRAELDVLFPISADHGASRPAIPLDGTTPPQIPGYEVLSELGHGGMGVVYEARHLRLQRTVALKMLLAGAYARPEERQRFQREAEAVAALRHPNVVQVYDVGDVDGRPYFTMELVEGGSLAERIRGVPQPARQSAALVATLADAVHAAHQRGVVHRDLKPANVLLAADGTPKVADFGLARRLDGGGELTLSGVPMGTPSYMSPCQARGDRSAMGPATDIWALGAILYELLTGRPPFRAETATATLQQVISDDPVPPARLNPQVPRDLQTICLKCLHKEPPRRYASAQALADDLRRFERGEPIAARPPGRLERLARWVRRHPALAVGALLVLTFTGVGAWWYGQRAAAARAAEVEAEGDLREAERLLPRGDCARAEGALERARLRLGSADPTGLRDRLGRLSAALELVRRLDGIRLERALVNPSASDRLDRILSVTTSRDSPETRRGSPSARRYEEAFRQAGVGAPGDDPAVAAERVRASPVRAALVAALDDWAACADGRGQQAWALAVARRADPDPWRDRLRNPATWDDPKGLADLAAGAPVAGQPPGLLAVLGARLRARGIDPEAFLKRVAATYPTDFWVNVETGNALYRPKPAEAVGYYRTALALRPQTVSLHYFLGTLYTKQQRWDECIAHFEQAVRLAPDDAWCHHGLGFGLGNVGRDDEALAQYREVLRIDPNNGWAHHNSAVTLEQKGRLEEALREYREALRLLSDREYLAQARRSVRDLLLRLRRWPEARAAWKEELAAHPPEHDAWFGYAELCLFLGDEKEYRRARRDLLARFGSATDPAVAERTARACLLLPGTEKELEAAAALTARAVAAGRERNEFGYPYFVFARGLADYRQGRWADALGKMRGEAARAELLGPCPGLVAALALHRKGQKEQARKALAAAVASYDWSAARADSRDPWIAHILRRQAEALILPCLPAFLEGKYKPKDNDERLALLGVCQFEDRRAALAGLYAGAFAADPKLAEDLRAGHRYNAARAAAVAGRGGGADGAGFREAERGRWRRQARAWLGQDLAAWAKRLEAAAPADRAEVHTVLARWREDPDLAGLRDAAALGKLPNAERQECQALWQEVAALLRRAQPPK